MRTKGEYTNETGISNAIVLLDLFEAHKIDDRRRALPLREGILQNQRGSVSVKAERVEDYASTPPLPARTIFTNLNMFHRNPRQT
jgi:hypothetical protein